MLSYTLTYIVIMIFFVKFVLFIISLIETPVGDITDTIVCIV